ncbi:MAG TPA: AAA family ATPase [Anaerolineales bacterium]|nr:AAA family ATPase [Anaerolineales bacterium]
MHRVVPELIVEKYRNGEFNGEFRAVSLFLDLSGFSRMTDTLMQHGQLGAEVLANLMHGVFDPLVENIFNHGGKIVSFAGDGIMALFPVEDEERKIALHAISAAWTMQHALLENPQRQTMFGVFQFSVKIGLSIGPVSWGILRSTGGGIATYYFRGSAVDDAARAEHVAQAGQIILTENIWTLLRDEVQTSSHAPHHRLDGFNVESPAPVPVLLSPIDLEIARLFMPEEIITENIHGEFRQIVNLFMRFPDLSYDELQELAQLVFELNDQYGGLINRLDFGDKGCNMLMLWGAPVTYENDIGRALNFILDLKARVDFPITAGVTYYIAHAGYLGSAMCEDYTCYGWGVNLASRFMMSAPDGSIWTDERIARRVKNRFDFEYRGSQRFKGFAAEEKVYSLYGRKSQELFFQGEFVGRETELPRLIDCLQPVWKGEFAGLTVIWGEAGAGKSRLIYELRAALSYGGRKCLWAQCNADQILRHSFNPFRYWLLHYFDVDATMDTTLQLQAFDRKLNDLIGETGDAELASELDRLRSLLGSLLGLYWSESFYEQLDAEGRYNNTLNALIALIKAESLRQPVVLVVEDAHFIDEDSTLFLPRLKRALQSGNHGYPVAILVGSRPGGTHVKEFLTESLVDQSIELGGLSVQALSELAEIYLGGVASPELIQLLEARSEGNPYFAEQILIYLKEEGWLEMSNKGWSMKRRMQETALPTDIRALLVARLDQLPRRVRDVIQTAAVLGREFSVQHLAGMVPDDAALQNEIAEAERAHVWLAIRPFQYFFTHALLRDAAYAMQTHASRVTLHALAIHAMEGVYGEEIHHHYGELAHHAERASMAEKAFHYLHHAAKAATNAYQNSEAVDYYTRALAFVPPDDLAGQYDLLAERVELYSRMGKRDLQSKDLSALERWAEQLNDPLRLAQVMFQRATYHHTLGQYLEAVEYVKCANAYVIAETAPELGIKIQYTWSSALLRLGKLDEAMQQAQVGLQLARRFLRRADEARTLTVMGLIALEQKDPRGAHQYLEASLLTARELNERRLECYALNNLALSEGSVQGNYALAAKHYEEAYKMAREIGDRYQEGTTLVNLGFASGMQGNFTAAFLYYEDSLQVAREIGNLNLETYTLINMSAVAGLRNEASQALRFAQAADELSKKIHDRSAEAWSQLYKGYALLLMAEFAAARKVFQESISIRDELGQVYLAMEPRAGLVEVALCTNNQPAASLEAEKILSYLAGGGSLDGTEEPLRVYHACYQYLSQQKDPRAQQVLQAATQLLETQVSKFAEDNTRRAFIDNFPWRRALYEAAQA